MKFFCENEVENTPTLAKILNENERISFVHFREFRSTKILMETVDSSHSEIKSKVSFKKKL